MHGDDDDGEDTGDGDDGDDAGDDDDGDDDGGDDDADEQVSTYLPLLAKKGVLVQLGLVLGAHQVIPMYHPHHHQLCHHLHHHHHPHHHHDPQVVQMPLMFNKLSIAGSLIGGIPETQVMIIMVIIILILMMMEE